ncbi:RNA polymerase sigma factor [Knoellia subterranea]|uniref:RNA polymerase subunit sigma-24 n=1 Tax=Knoellia subterranea KCTC 19937 TaxID=1385521 RepID=A0A0A0JKT0_9MICO|nr:RNA polymerase sigma factor [Knoellia subterranea]KGN36256.1 RNA polymerase subunit sigma-24 [Knoellia subterranea KCTC 19937]
MSTTDSAPGAQPRVDAADTSGATHRAVEAIWRIESGRLIAGLARVTGDVGIAEDMAQEALVAALEQWPRTGVPPNPAGWLMTTAKRRAIDAHRRESNFGRKAAVLGEEAVSGVDSDAVIDAMDDHVHDDVLRLLLTACHPVLSLESRVALTLRCLAGLSTDEIARAFLVPEATAAQRIVRAKNTLADRGVQFELPGPEELSERMSSVLEVVYLVFNEGYSATSGSDWTRPDLCNEAIRLGRLLAGLVPEEPEVHGLLALMEFQASRLPARVGPSGEAVLLPDQDRRLWDRLLVRRGLEGLTRAESLGKPLGPYSLQAGIAACHARALRADDTDWARIVSLYDVLVRVWPSPVVALNRAVAVSFLQGPEAGLKELETVAASGRLDLYPHLHAARGDLHARSGRLEEAAEAFARAAELSRNEADRATFTRRATELRGTPG